ncbi:fucolectin-3-like [Menidia menidia]
MAVDDTRSARPDETCASVPQQDHPWWQLDLRSVYRITAVSVTASACCPEQLDGAEIRVGLGNATHNQRCATITTGGQSTVSYQCEVQLARFVHVLLPGRQRNLTVCEVRVYGTVLENVALRGVARQSSSRWRTAGRAGSVIDGVQFTTCSLTKEQPGQWVMVDLLVPYAVTVVQLAFAEECPGQVDVFVDDKRFPSPKMSHFQHPVKAFSVKV